LAGNAADMINSKASIKKKNIAGEIETKMCRIKNVRDKKMTELVSH
jgi:hypothetical protein